MISICKHYCFVDTFYYYLTSSYRSHYCGSAKETSLINYQWEQLSFSSYSANKLLVGKKKRKRKKSKTYFTHSFCFVLFFHFFLSRDNWTSLFSTIVLEANTKIILTTLSSHQLFSRYCNALLTLNYSWSLKMISEVFPELQRIYFSVALWSFNFTEAKRWEKSSFLSKQFLKSQVLDSVFINGIYKQLQCCTEVTEGPFECAP